MKGTTVRTGGGPQDTGVGSQGPLTRVGVGSGSGQVGTGVTVPEGVGVQVGDPVTVKVDVGVPVAVGVAEVDTGVGVKVAVGAKGGLGNPLFFAQDEKTTATQTAGKKTNQAWGRIKPSWNGFLPHLILNPFFFRPLDVAPALPSDPPPEKKDASFNRMDSQWKNK